jgi:hypothetical protein
MSEISDRIDAAKAALLKTTISGVQYAKNGQPSTGNWGKAWALLEQAKELDAPAPPAPPPNAWPIAPQGTLTLKDGDRTQNAGVYYDAWSSPSAEIGRTIQGVHVRNYLREGIGFLWWWNGANPPAKDSPAGSVYTIRDCIAENIGIDANQNGTTEFAFRFGQAFDAARIVAITGPNGWCAIWMGGRATGKLSDFNIEAIGHLGPTGGGSGKVGIYVEHAAHDIVITRGKIHSTGNCINGEWWYTDPNYASFMEAAAAKALPGRAGPYRIQVGESGKGTVVQLQSDEGSGVYYGPGMYGGKIAGVKFVGCPRGAIVLEKRLALPIENVVDLDSCDFSECDGPHVVYQDLAIG